MRTFLIALPRAAGPRRAIGAAALLALLPLLAACPTAGVYRTARTLNQGEVDLAIVFSTTHLSIPSTTTTDPQTGATTAQQGVSVTFPNPVPELAAHYGITDDVEIGGRVALSALMGEIDLKLRVAGDRDAPTHVAFAPAVGYRTFLFIEGPHVTLPLILTHDFNRDFSINLAGYGGYRSLHVVSNSTSSDLNNLAVQAGVVGGSVGFEFRGERAYVMPMVDVARTVFGDDKYGTQSYVIVGLALGAVTNRRGAAGTAPAPPAATPPQPPTAPPPPP